MNDPRGSLWRKWDFHFHTPASFDYANKSVTAERIVESLKAAEIAAVIVTDHHTIDVAIIREIIKHAGEDLAVFPGVELRSELGGSQSVHYTGIFPTSDLASLWTTLQGKLEITPEHVAKRGGDEGIYVSFELGCDTIHELGGIVAVHAGRKSNSLEEIPNTEKFKQVFKKNALIEKVDILEIGQIRDQSDYKDIVFPKTGVRLPMVMGSDSHNAADYKLKELCWVKADTTFEGLKQILNEPVDRVFVGDLPQHVQMVQSNKTKYLDSVSIRKCDTYDLNEKWFDFSLPLNSGLIAIIGNKGSGKSALADTIGLLGNSRHDADFSFLNPSKFREPRPNRAERFVGSMDWLSGAPAKKGLHTEIDRTQSESVKYIPQNYLEKICDELKSGGDTVFEKEVKAMIFSHQRDSVLFDEESLDDMISYATETTYEAITLLKQTLHDTNVTIAGAENKLTPEYKATLKNQLAEKERQLDAHDRSKPREKPEPKNDASINEQMAKIAKTLANLKKDAEKLAVEIKRLQEKYKEQQKLQAAAEKLEAKLRNLDDYVQTSVSAMEEELKILGLSHDKVVEFKIEYSLVQELTMKARGEVVRLNNQLDPDKPDTPAAKQKSLSVECEKLSKELDRPNREYQDYLRAVEKWNADRKAIIGAQEILGTLEYIKKQIADLAKVPEELESATTSRLKTIRMIYGKITDLATKYGEFFAPVRDFVSAQDLPADKFQLDFHVNIINKGFADDFFKHVTHGKSGSFCGVDEALKRLGDILAAVDFSSEQGVLEFLSTIEKNLAKDLRKGEGESVPITEQLRKPDQVVGFYDYLYSLDYLKPQFALRWADKDLSQLSPGERGSLLLIFYLLLDNTDIPLIIDQPEGNLDNQTVFDILVPCIKRARNRRQVMIVTHNPNLAVVADADQVIYSSLDKKDGNRIDYESGSIENPAINKRIVDVLEGTRPAFDNREAKYDIIPLA